MKFFKKENEVESSNASITPNKVLPKVSSILHPLHNINLGLIQLKPAAISHKSNAKKKLNKNVAKVTEKEDKSYHWQSGGNKHGTFDDMVLLTRISESAITENLRKRLMEDKIYTYIGPVLVAVNPFKNLQCYGEQQIAFYQEGGAYYEAPPHVYAIADSMYKNMITDNENQCAIISGESGAGKTVSAKHIMSYLTEVSGGGERSQHVKEVIRESNPLLEAFGNAKTIKNNNSSRFGKYIKIAFSSVGEPVGGTVSNFLLEKSRVHFLNNDERNFHIFYQICAGATEEMRESLGIGKAEEYTYLSQSGVHQVDGMNDAKDFGETLQAMQVMGLDEETVMNILGIVAAILQMGMIEFEEVGNDAAISDHNYLDFPAFLLGVEKEQMNRCLTSHVIETKWSSKSELVTVTHNCEQAYYARDAWTKGLYSRLFDYLVAIVNEAMAPKSSTAAELTLGILDIYGFEIFENNGFEQFCINFVNEKLQQIFIDLTLKSEQEEYKMEGIQWKEISFFNNKEVCDLIESGRNPVGILRILDDTCSVNTLSGADRNFKDKMIGQLQSNPYLQSAGDDCFLVKHYAGNVTYNVEGFCDKNRDLLFQDIIKIMQTTKNSFVNNLFGEENLSKGPKGRPSTAGTQIRQQANDLVTQLSLCIPHYIRCIKPNETKKPKDWNETMVKHQVEYLGLRENIKVKRAGFAYRRPFEKFINRYAILSVHTFPFWHGSPQEGIEMILQAVKMDPSQYQIGRTKAFIKDPESLYMLEECRDRKYNHYARIIQKWFREKFNHLRSNKDKMEASKLLKLKERRSDSINRHFYGDYIGLSDNLHLSRLIPKKERIIFAQTIDKYNRQLKVMKRDLILTSQTMRLIGREKIKKGADKGKLTEVVKRKIDLEQIEHVTLSKLEDSFCLIQVHNDYSNVLEIPFKTEFVYLLNKCLTERGKSLSLKFADTFSCKIRKSGFGGGGETKIQFATGPCNRKTRGRTLFVTIEKGLTAGSMPSNRRTPVKSAGSHRNPPAIPTHTDKSHRPTRPGAPLIRPKPGAPPIPPSPGSQPIPPSPRSQPIRPSPGSQPIRPSPGAPLIPPIPGSQLIRPSPGAPPIPLPLNHSAPPVEKNIFILSQANKNPQLTSNYNAPKNTPSPIQSKHPTKKNLQSPLKPSIPNPSPPLISSLSSHSPHTNHKNNSSIGNKRPNAPYVSNSSPSPVLNKAPSSYINKNSQVKTASPNSYNRNKNGTVEQIREDNQADGEVNNENWSNSQFDHTPSPPLSSPPLNQPVVRPIPPPKKMVKKVRALYGYTACESDEITCEEGDILELLKEDDSGWWTCRFNSKIGFCPGNYLEYI